MAGEREGRMTPLRRAIRPKYDYLICAFKDEGSIKMNGHVWPLPRCVVNVVFDALFRPMEVRLRNMSWWVGWWWLR